MTRETPTFPVLRVRVKINLHFLGVEALTWQGTKIKEYLDILYFCNAAR
jgi:hypothetical protein